MSAAERKQIDEAVAGQTLPSLFQQVVSENGDVTAHHWKGADGEWITQTWSQFADRVKDVANGLIALGLEPGEFINILSENRPEHIEIDMAAAHAGGTPVSLYNSLAPEQIEYIVNHSEAKYVVVSNREYYEKVLKVRESIPSVRKVVMFEGADEFSDDDFVMSYSELVEAGREYATANPGDFEARWKAVKPEDLVTLIYTSGTTGPPKGVMISNYNVCWTAESLFRMYPIQPGVRHISYLPLAHIAERMAGYYLSVRAVGSCYFCPDPRRIAEYLPVARPQLFFAVPRIWEKIESALRAGVANLPDEGQRKMATEAIEAKMKIVSLEMEGSEIPAELKELGDLADAFVTPNLRDKVGMDEMQIAVSGAAPIGLETLQFFAAIGIPIAEVYGQSEGTGPTSQNRTDKIKIGTVGPAIPGVELMLADDGELLQRGGNNMQGYYKEPEKTAETIDDDGWLHTGDIATIDDDGYVKIVDRKKEIIITAGGKNIAPSNIEGLLKQHELIGQAAVIGDRRPYLVALVVLDSESALPWAEKNGLPTDFSALSEHPKVREIVQAHLDKICEQLHNQEQPKKFTILPNEWTPETDELTPTLKLKRRIINTKYADEIEALYA